MDGMPDARSIEKFIAEKFKLTDYETDLRQACFLDYYVLQYWWACKEKNFNHEQTSSYFSIVYNLFENLSIKHYSLSENIDDFKLMLSVLNERMRLFTDQQLKDIISHLTLTFFQNIKLYSFVCDEQQDEMLISKEIEVECPKLVDLPYPAPLDEALPIEIFNKYILHLPDEPTEEEKKRMELQNSDNIVLPDELIEQIRDKFDGLSLEDAKKIILEVTNDVIADLKVI